MNWSGPSTILREVVSYTPKVGVGTTTNATITGCVVPVTNYDDLIVMAQWQTEDPAAKVSLEVAWANGVDGLPPDNAWANLLPHAVPEETRMEVPMYVPCHRNIARLGFSGMRGCTIGFTVRKEPRDAAVDLTVTMLSLDRKTISFDWEGDRIRRMEMYGGWAGVQEEQEKLFVAVGKKGLEQLLEKVLWWTPNGERKQDGDGG